RAFRLSAAVAAREVVRILAEDLERDARGVFENCDNHLRGNPDDPVALVRRGLSRIFIKRTAEGQADVERAGNLVPEFRASGELTANAAPKYEADKKSARPPRPEAADEN